MRKYIVQLYFLVRILSFLIYVLIICVLSDRLYSDGWDPSCTILYLAFAICTSVNVYIGYKIFTLNNNTTSKIRRSFYTITDLILHLGIFLYITFSIIQSFR